MTLCSTMTFINFIIYQYQRNWLIIVCYINKVFKQHSKKAMDQLNDMFKDGVQQFINYEKDVGQKKSRPMKRKEKLQKLRADLKDPVQRKQRNKQRRDEQKQKLNRQLEGKTQQEVRKFLDAKRDKKKMIKERNIKALKYGMPILIDLVYEGKMNEKQNKSLVCQIQLILRAVKDVENPPGIHLCSLQGGIKTQLQKMAYQHWAVASYPSNIVEVGMQLEKKLIYLSPDATQPVEEIDENTAFIIGGLVDRTVIRNASLNRANQLKIEARCLPVRKYMKNRACLNLDHVVMILCKYRETKDWKVAFDYGSPKRWKKEEGQNNRRKRQKKRQQKGQEQIQEQSNEQQNFMKKEQLEVKTQQVVNKQSQKQQSVD